MVNQASSAHQNAVLAGLRNKDPRFINSFFVTLQNKAQLYFQKRYPEFQYQLLEDCISEAFIKFLEKIQSPQFIASNLMGYAFEILRLHFKNRLKSNGLITSTDPILLPEQAQGSLGFSYSALEFFETHTTINLTQWFISLSPEEKQLLELRLQGYKLEEISQKLHLAYGTIRNKNTQLLNQARALATNTQ